MLRVVLKEKSVLSESKRQFIPVRGGTGRGSNRAKSKKSCMHSKVRGAEMGCPYIHAERRNELEM